MGRGEAIGMRQPPISSAAVGLSLLVPQLHREILTALAHRGPLTIVALAGWLLLKSRSALETHLEQLAAAEVVGRTEHESEAVYRLTPAGRALAEVLGVAATWIRSHPRRPLADSSPVAWRAFATLAEHWRSTVIESIVRGAPSDSELAGRIAGLSRRKRREELARLRAAGIVELRRDRDGVERYRPTDWGRRGVGVLAAAAAWEQRFAADPVAIVVADALVGLRASLPLARLDPGLSGVCALTAAVEPGSAARPRAGIVRARLRRGRVVSCVEGPPRRRPDAWIAGSLSAWLDAAVRNRPGSLRLGGDEVLARTLVEQIHLQLYDYCVPEPSRLAGRRDA